MYLTDYHTFPSRISHFTCEDWHRHLPRWATCSFPFPGEHLQALRDRISFAWNLDCSVLCKRGKLIFHPSQSGCTENSCFSNQMHFRHTAQISLPADNMCSHSLDERFMISDFSCSFGGSVGRDICLRFRSIFCLLSLQLMAKGLHCCSCIM